MSLEVIKQTADLSQELGAVKAQLDTIWDHHKRQLSEKITAEFGSAMKQNGFTVAPSLGGGVEAKYKGVSIQLIPPTNAEQVMGAFMRFTIEHTQDNKRRSHYVLAIKQRPERSLRDQITQSPIVTQGELNILRKNIEDTKSEILSFDNFAVSFAVIRNSHEAGSRRSDERFTTFTDALNSLLA